MSKISYLKNLYDKKDNLKTDAYLEPHQVAESTGSRRYGFCGPRKKEYRTEYKVNWSKYNKDQKNLENEIENTKWGITQELNTKSAYLSKLYSDVSSKESKNNSLKYEINVKQNLKNKLTDQQAYFQGIKSQKELLISDLENQLLNLGSNKNNSIFILNSLNTQVNSKQAELNQVNSAKTKENNKYLNLKNKLDYNESKNKKFKEIKNYTETLIEKECFLSMENYLKLEIIYQYNDNTHLNQLSTTITQNNLYKQRANEITERSDELDLKVCNKFEKLDESVNLGDHCEYNKNI